MLAYTRTLSSRKFGKGAAKLLKRKDVSKQHNGSAILLRGDSLSRQVVNKPKYNRYVDLYYVLLFPWHKSIVYPHIR